MNALFLHSYNTTFYPPSLRPYQGSSWDCDHVVDKASISANKQDLHFSIYFSLKSNISHHQKNVNVAHPFKKQANIHLTFNHSIIKKYNRVCTLLDNREGPHWISKNQTRLNIDTRSPSIKTIPIRKNCKNKKNWEEKSNLVLFPLRFLGAMFGNMVFSFADETALSRFHARDSKWVFSKLWFIGFLGLQLALLSLLLGWVFGGCWLGFREQFGVRLFVDFPSNLLSLAHHPGCNGGRRPRKTANGLWLLSGELFVVGGFRDEGSSDAVGSIISYKFRRFCSRPIKENISLI